MCSGRRGRTQRNLKRGVFVSWLLMDTSEVWVLLFLLEVALLGKVQATYVPPVLKQKVYDEEKLLWVKSSWDTSCSALRMPHRCWCCSWLHHGIAPASPSLQEAFCPSPRLLGTSQPAEGICRVRTADNSVWGWTQGFQWTSQIQCDGMVLGQ